VQPPRMIVRRIIRNPKIRKHFFFPMVIHLLQILLRGMSKKKKKEKKWGSIPHEMPQNWEQMREHPKEVA
jgi:hypothetical protein